MVKMPVASVDEVPENGSVLFTVEEADGGEEEVILVRVPGGCEEGAAVGVDGDALVAYRNFCQHETDQRLDRGMGVAMRDGGVICPKHGSIFDACSGYCDNGEAEGSTLVSVDVEVDGGKVFLAEDGLRYLHDGPIEDDDDGPDSTSHLRF